MFFSKYTMHQSDTSPKIISKIMVGQVSPTPIPFRKKYYLLGEETSAIKNKLTVCLSFLSSNYILFVSFLFSFILHRPKRIRRIVCKWTRSGWEVESASPTLNAFLSHIKPLLSRTPSAPLSPASRRRPPAHHIFILYSPHKQYNKIT